MKLLRILLPFFCLAAMAVSCGDEDPVLLQDFRDEFVGIYDCEKGSTTIELEVSKDPDNDGNVIIGPYSIPIDENGDYGPMQIEQNVTLELKMDGTNIIYNEYKAIINGIAAPCELEGVKRT